MAQLKDSVVQGSLRVTDTTYTNNLIISNTTAPTIATNDYLIIADASDGNKLLKGPGLNTSNTTKWLTQAGTWTTPTASNVGLGNVSNNSSLNGAAGTKGDMIYWSDKDTPARLGIGTATHLLVATANGPRWSANAHINDTSNSSTANQANELVLGNSTASTSNGSSFGRLALYSENTAGTRLVSASGTAWKTATLQAKDGTIAYTADITSAIQALDVTAITGSASKTLTSISETDGKISATYSDISIGADAIASGTVANARLPARLQEYHTTAIDTDSTFTSGWHYSSTNSPFTKYHSSNKDFMVWAHAHTAAKWGSEIATDFRSNRIAVRNINNGTWNSWKELGSFTDPVNEYSWTSDIIYDDIENQFTNTRASDSWASQVYSKHGFSDGCYVSFRPVDKTHHIMLGLNSDPTTNANWTGIDYAWYLKNDGNIDMRESNTTKASIEGHTTYNANDDFRIEYSDGYIRYYHNGVLCRSIARSISGQLYLDTSFYNGGSIKDLRFGPLKNGNLVSKDLPGLAPKGAAVSSQSTSTKFLREDGTWAAPSYIANAAYGNLSTAGKITTAITLATDDFLIIGDNSDGGKIGKGPAFNTSNTTKWLTQAGTWTTPTAANVGAATSGHTQAVDKGGTNITSYTKGDILYASAGTTLSKLAISTTEGAILNVASGVPAWTTNYTANELVWYANSSTSTYYYITTDYVSTAEHWFYGTIVGTRGTTSGSTSICTFQIHTNGSGNVNHAQYTDRDFLITNFRVHKDSSNKIIISLTVTNQYSRMRMRLYADNSASYLNYAKSVTTTAPTVSSTYSGIPYWNLTPTNMQYYRGQWGNANTVRMTTNGSIGFPAFAYKNYHLGSSNSFGIPASAVLIETTTNGTASSPTWTTGTSALYTDAAKRDMFAFGTTVLPVANLPATDYWNRSSDGISFTASGTNGTHYRPNIAVGMGIRVTADFTVFLRYLYFSVIEARWLSYYHTTTCKIETYNTANNTWTLIYSEDIVNADTTRYYHLGTEKYVRGNRATNTTDISKVRWTMVVKTLNTAAVPDNARYAPCVGGFNLYGFGMPSNDNSISSRFAYEMARHGQPIYVTSYTAGSGLGAARVPTQDLYIGDDLRSTAANTEKWANLIIGNAANVNAANTHCQGRIYLYSAATAAHIIVGSSTTTEYTHTLPNNTGMIVSLSGSTAKGSGTKPVYVPATGIVTECSTYAGGTAVTLNNASKAASTASFYAPTAGGTAGHILIGAGTTTAPAWNGALTLGGTAAASYTATINGKLIGSSYNYGATLPSSPTTGQIFFQTCDTSGFVRNTGDTMTGRLKIAHSTYGSCVELWSDGEGGNIFLHLPGSGGNTSNTGYEIDTCGGNLRIYRTVDNGVNGTHIIQPLCSDGTSHFLKLYGAVWNDYAEFRRDNIQEKDRQKPGNCVYELGDGTLALTTKRLQYGCEIISDTYGFAIGQNNECNTPIASNGRVLAYPFENIEVFRKHIGRPVCSGPNGTVSIMTEEEEQKHPSCIVGTISEIPSYKRWGTGNVEVNGRVWIRVR